GRPRVAACWRKARPSRPSLDPTGAGRRGPSWRRNQPATNRNTPPSRSPSRSTTLGGAPLLIFSPTPEILPFDPPFLRPPRFYSGEAVMPWQFLVIDGADREQIFLLPQQGVVVIGGSKKHADICLHDLYVQRTHCEIEISEEDTVLVRNLRPA